MDAVGGHVKWSKPGSERQKLHLIPPMWKRDPNINNYTKQTLWYANPHLEHVHNSWTTLCNLKKEGKEKKLAECEQYNKT
jgi:hypothetical protein